MKRQFCLGVAALIVASPALATESRVEGLGGIGSYVNDDTNQFLFPQLAKNYTGNAYLELKQVGSPDAVQSGGASFVAPRWDDWAIGLYLNRSAPGALMHSYTPAMNLGSLTSLLIGNGTWGLGLSWGGDNIEVDGSSVADGVMTEEFGMVSEVALGYTGQVFGRSTTDASARVVMASGEQTFKGSIADGAAPDVEESNFAFQFSARNHYAQRRSGRLIGTANFGMASGEIDFEDAEGATFDSKTETSAMAFGFGAGWEMPVTGNTVATLVIEPFTYSTAELTTPTGEDDETVTTTTTTTFPSFFFSVEGPIRSWLHGRAGVAQIFGTNKTKTEVTTDGDTSESEATSAATDFEISFGMTVKVNDTWSIDGVFNDAHLFGGPNIISGAAPGPFFARVSVTGTWN